MSGPRHRVHVAETVQIKNSVNFVDPDLYNEHWQRNWTSWTCSWLSPQLTLFARIHNWQMLFKYRNGVQADARVGERQRCSQPNDDRRLDAVNRSQLLVACWLFLTKPITSSNPFSLREPHQPAPWIRRILALRLEAVTVVQVDLMIAGRCLTALPSQAFSIMMIWYRQDERNDSGCLSPQSTTLNSALPCLTNGSSSFSLASHTV